MFSICVKLPPRDTCIAEHLCTAQISSAYERGTAAAIRPVHCAAENRSFCLSSATGQTHNLGGTYTTSACKEYKNKIDEVAAVVAYKYVTVLWCNFLGKKAEDTCRHMQFITATNIRSLGSA